MVHMTGLERLGRVRVQPTRKTFVVKELKTVVESKAVVELKAAVCLKATVEVKGVNCCVEMMLQHQEYRLQDLGAHPQSKVSQ